MNPLSLKYRANFWDKAASGHNENFTDPIVFEDPINIEKLSQYLPMHASVLDFGCGYGRITNELYQSGFEDVKGVDISPKMLERAKNTFPHLEDNLFIYNGETLPFEDDSFDAITAFTVLNAIPTDALLEKIFIEFRRILKKSGIIYLYEFMLTPFDRDVKRYDEFQKNNPEMPYGTFEHKSGCIMRHFDNETIEQNLLKEFNILWQDSFEFKSMSGNPCVHDQWIARINKK
ncbi:MAG: class I SAM-dependent methyltransferase [Gammaproteobacteria bacterium]